MDPLISIRDVSCRIAPQLTLQVGALSLHPGQHWCLFGGNGSGTSLLARLIRGQLIAGRAGVSYAPGFDPRRDILEVSFEEQRRFSEHDDRHDISDYDASASDVGTTVRRLVCGPAAQQVSAGADADAEKGDEKGDDEAALTALLTRLGIYPLIDRGIRYLSSGQMRRAMLARALYQNPNVLLLDNPLESIDRQTADVITRTLQAWMRNDNLLIVLARRKSGVLPGLTHMALMRETAYDANGRWIRELSLHQSGPLSEVSRSDHYQALTEPRAIGPDQLPPPCPGREPPALDADVPLVDLDGVDVGYGDRVLLESFHWQMRVGDHVLIEGPNGCGKSTLLALISGDNHKAYGQPVRLFGRQRGSGESVWQVKSRFGVVSNDLHQRYIKGWRVLDVVVSGFFDSLGLYDDSGSSEHNCARAWLRAVQLGDVHRAWYHELSFGQQRLVLLARAMVKHPAILILDEPCTGLDDYHCDLLLALLDRIAREGRTHLMFVSHTDGDTPACINRYLRFDGQGGVVTGDC